ncbi:putative MYH7B protein [Trypanosoma theileri]|uniref:Putative MYH7B protein n=1 Tax=Trypanosoma theileri TaxID=67003 RepID=A0A1X0P4D4_9TRYP|nr:putative MYH7B protein [Trypanosoma theileri]ORC91782.1 putative MYH7B protein [Trypanosoma theileri]
MRANTPAVRAGTPVPRRPGPLLLLPNKRESSPIQQRRSSIGCSATSSPAKILVFQRAHAPVVENTPLPEETLRTLRHTRSLFLCCRNLLSFSNIRYLEYMTQLTSLNVHMNSISRIECLGHLQHLTELDISANELRAVDEDAFKGLRQLKRLNLSSNFLTSINSFQHLPCLEWLSLSFNELTDLRGLRRLPCPKLLLHLDICGNKIATLSELESSLENCRDLQDLRVETPRASIGLPTLPQQLRLRENPFCVAQPNYAERLLQLLPRLFALNGVPCGYDPTRDGMQIDRTVTDNHNEQIESQELDLSSPIVVSPHVTPQPRNTDLLPCVTTALNTSKVSESMTYTESSSTGASSSDSNDSSSYSKDVGGRNSSSPQCRSKRISRAVVTNVSIPPYKEFHVSSVEEEILQKNILAKEEHIEHLEQKFMRAQEQLSLRVALEEDLRRNLNDVRQAHVALTESASNEKKLLCRQISALKDELSRRSEETAILQRRNRVELEEQTNALRNDLLKQKKESAASLKRMSEELSKVRKLSNDRVTELNTRLDDAIQQNEWLEKQNEVTQNHMKKLQNDLLGCRTSLLSCEKELHLSEEIYRLQLDELLVRRRLESAMWIDLFASLGRHVQVLHHEYESIVIKHRSYQKSWEEYTASLQQHYREALLQVQATRVTSPIHKDVGCDPIFAVIQQEENEKQQREKENMEELRQLKDALSIVRQSEHLLSRENERLLACVTEKERELAVMSQQKQDSDLSVQQMKENMDRERDNLLRTLHNLRETIEKKDLALDELEAEAKLKIDEKRSVIAKLEERLEDAEEAAANHHHETARLRRVEEELRRVKEELWVAKKEQQEATTPPPLPPPPPQQQLTELIEALDDTKQKLASSMVREHQQTVKLMRAVEALTVVREQLARVGEANTRLTRELSEKEASLRLAESEQQRLQAQWREAQEATRVRQRATLQALSHIIMEGDESKT